MRRPPIDLESIAAAVARSPSVAQPLLLRLLGMTVAVLRQRILREDRRQVAEAERAPGSPAAGVYCIDGYHGGVTFWDWIVLPRGGLWYGYCWDLIGRLLVHRASGDLPLHVVLDLDGHTYEHMARWKPEAIADLREAVRTGAIEVANGTYGQPLSQTVSGESLVRHFHYGLAAVEKTLGVRVESFLSQEPLFVPQLPQILIGFGFRQAVFRTHWAAFGSDPAHDATVVRWRGPDGSQVRTVPRYRFMDYVYPREEEHQGLEKGGLAGTGLPRWDGRRVGEFGQIARERGIDRPLITRAADINVEDPAHPHAPLANAVRLASQGLRFLTLKEYFRSVQEDGPNVAYSIDQIPATIPWGLGGERLLKARTEAEGRLLVAERLDAVAHALGRPSEEEKLDRAWKRLLLAQHHDLHVCGPWLSHRHGKSMAEVGIDLATAAAQTADAVAERALEYLASAVAAGAGEEQGLLVFNPSPWPRREYVQGADSVVDLPPLGYRTVAAQSAAQEPQRPASPPCSADMLPDGTLSLKADGRRLLEGGYLTVWKDGRWYDSRQSVASLRLADQGPAYRRWLAEGRLAEFPFRLWVTVYAALPRIDFRLEVDFPAGGEYFGPQLEDGQPGLPYYVNDARKLCVNFVTPLRRSFCPSPFLLSRSENDRLIGIPFLGLEDAGGRVLGLLNRGTPGYHFDRHNGIVRNVLAWAPRRWPYASDDSLTRGRSRFTALSGRHVYEYAIVPCDSRLAALRAAIDYQFPCLTSARPPGGGSLPPTASFLGTAPDSALLSALFVQNGNIYARLWNGSPRRRQARLTHGNEDARMWAVSLDLRDEKPVDTVALRPWGILTIRLESLGGRAST